MLMYSNSPENPQPPPDPNDSVEALGYSNLFFPMAILAGGVAVGLFLVILEQVSMTIKNLTWKYSLIVWNAKSYSVYNPLAIQIADAPPYSSVWYGGWGTLEGSSKEWRCQEIVQFYAGVANIIALNRYTTWKWSSLGCRANVLCYMKWESSPPIALSWIHKYIIMCNKKSVTFSSLQNTYRRF